VRDTTLAYSTHLGSVKSAQPLLMYIAALATDFERDLARRSETHIFVLPTLTTDKRFRVISVQRVTFTEAYFADMLLVLNLNRPDTELNVMQLEQKAAFSGGQFPSHRISVTSSSGTQTIGSSPRGRLRASRAAPAIARDHFSAPRRLPRRWSLSALLRGGRAWRAQLPGSQARLTARGRASRHMRI